MPAKRRGGKAPARPPAMRIRRGDRVKVLAGKSAGHIGEVLRIDRAKQKVFVEGAMIQRVATKPRSMKDLQKPAQATGIIEREGPIHVSNVALIDPTDNRPTRISVVREGGIRSRRSARSGTKLD